MPAYDTRQRIAGAATMLFNERGTAAVSTNHIAEAAGVSPGNLYYHFRNKEEIIRDIFERMNAAWARVNGPPLDDASSPGDLRRILGETLTLLYEYRFFYREFVALMQRDPILGQRYREVRRAGLANTEVLLRNFVTGGFLHDPGDPDTLPRLANVVWLITEFWLPFAEMGDDAVEPPRFQEGIDLLLQVLQPYLTEDAMVTLGAPKDHTIDHEATS